MDWQNALLIVIPLASFLGWIYRRIDKKFEVMMLEIKELRKDVQSLDTRVSRIEGFLAGPTHWEPRIILKKDVLE